jgi:hypothetical protein
MTAITLMMRPTDNGWAVSLSNGQRTLPGLRSATLAPGATRSQYKDFSPDSLAFSTMRVGDFCWSRLRADRPGNGGADVEYRQSVGLPIGRSADCSPSDGGRCSSRALDFNMVCGE